ncbi:MAG: hypothetical protein K0S18_1277 [Anaerocolumna sp.]|jgi:predicted metal-dependent phosphoesterase TrpH|nr:hypothetical protein [Anaerocolumna sp.]
MRYIDLHVHSTASDGSYTPAEVVALAIKQDLAAFALTDHDTVDGILEAQEAVLAMENTHKKIEVIPGTELSVDYKSRDIHILGLFIDPGNLLFRQALETARVKRDERNIKMADNLNKAGIDITVEKMRETDGKSVLTRAHFAKFMVAHGYVKSTKDAFTRFLNSDSPYYVPREYLSPEEAIELIHSAGGLAILAHPLLYKYNLLQVEELVKYLSERNIDGLEAIYSSNTGFDEGRMRHLANKYNLLITGGSDFHGALKPDLKIGVGKGNLKIPYTIVESLKQELGRRSSIN